jgi:hypothetical protein
MAKEVVHMSEAEAAAAALLKRIDEGADIMIERESRQPAILRSEHLRPGRLLSESIALAEAHGSTVTLDGNFSRDLEDHQEPSRTARPTRMGLNPLSLRSGMLDSRCVVRR